MSMNRILCLAMLVAALPVTSAPAQPLLLCGWDEVFVLETSQAEGGKNDKLWSWRAADREELPQSVRGTFRTTDDCKPVDQGTKILISSSSGGCALVERPSGRVVWHARVPNAHSLELLPRDRVIVASSVSPQGNRLVLFDVARSDEPVWQTPLVSAHGVVWDHDRQSLWALGLDELRCYAPKDWDSSQPSFALTASYHLPDDGGHDLQAIPQSKDLVLTTGAHVYLFDREERQFRLHPELGGKPRVKCVSTDRVSGRTVFIQASSQEWWTDTLGFLAPAAEIRLPGERLYKARWIEDRAESRSQEPVAPLSTQSPAATRK